MFQDAFQDGPFLLLYEARTSVHGTNPNLKWNIEGPKRAAKMVWDTCLGTQVTRLGPSAPKLQMSLSYPGGLGIRQACLCLQVMVEEGDAMGLDLHVNNKTGGDKHILYFSSMFREISHGEGALHSKVPLQLKRTGVWTTLCVDIDSIVRSLFKGGNFQTLDSITIQGGCYLKRVFTLKASPYSEEMSEPIATSGDAIPRSLQLSSKNESKVGIQVVTMTPRPVITSQTSCPQSLVKADLREDGKPQIAFGSRVKKLPPRKARSSSGTPPHSAGRSKSLAGAMGCLQIKSETSGTVPQATVASTTPDPQAPSIDSARPNAQQPRATSGKRRRNQGGHLEGMFISGKEIMDEHDEETDPLFISGVSLSQMDRTPPATVAAAAVLSTGGKQSKPVSTQKHSGSGGGPSTSPAAVLAHSEALMAADSATNTNIAIPGVRTSLPASNLSRMEHRTPDRPSSMNHASNSNFTFHFSGGPAVLNNRQGNRPSLSPKQLSYERETDRHQKSSVTSGSARMLKTFSVDSTDDLEEGSSVMPPFLGERSDLSLNGIRGGRRDTTRSAENSVSADVNLDLDWDIECEEVGAPLANRSTSGGGLIAADGGYRLPTFSAVDGDSRLSDRSSASMMSWMDAGSSRQESSPGYKLTESEKAEFNVTNAASPDDEDSSVIIHAINNTALSRASSFDVHPSLSRMESSLGQTLDIGLETFGDSFGNADRLQFVLQYQQEDRNGGEEDDGTPGLWEEEADVVNPALGPDAGGSRNTGKAVNELGVSDEVTAPTLDNDLDYSPVISRPMSGEHVNDNGDGHEKPKALYPVDQLLPVDNSGF